MIVIGASLGGMAALRTILQALPLPFPLPIVAALHRHKDSDDTLINLVQMSTKLPVREVVDKDTIEPGQVYLAPPNYHLMVEPAYFSLSTDDLVQYARPSIDVLFESAADSFGSRVIAVVLTGANQDGARGAVRIKNAGGLLIIQDPDTAECPIMPAAALQAIQPDHLCPAEAIGPLLLELVAQRFPLRS